MHFRLQCSAQKSVETGRVRHGTDVPTRQCGHATATPANASEYCRLFLAISQPIDRQITASTPANYQPGTSAAIIAGTIGGSGTISMSWRTRAPGEVVNSGGPSVLPAGAASLASQVVNLQGMTAGTTYVMQMDFSPGVETTGTVVNGVPDPASSAYHDAPSGRLSLAKLSSPPGGGFAVWHNAVTDNVDSLGTWTPVTSGRKTTYVYAAGAPAVGAEAYGWADPQTADVTAWLDAISSADGSLPKILGSYVNDSTHPFLGSFNSFLTEVEQSAVYPPTGAPFTFSGLDDIRGAWGVDISNNTVWAVLDQSGGVFAVDPGRSATDRFGGSVLSVPTLSLATVPEPGTLGLLGASGLCLAAAAWRRRRRA